MPTHVVTRTPDRRVPTQRGLQTRQKLMDATIELLATRSYRDIKVLDVAKTVGTSPAAFYQYFPDIEGVVLEASQLLAEETNTALDSFKDGAWSSDGLPGATRLVDAVLDGWSGHLPVVRVLTAVAAERDPRFVKAYFAATRPVLRALTAASTQTTPSGESKELFHALVSGLTATAGHENAGSLQGLTKNQRRRGLARLVHAAVTTADV
ncbi:TetR/AcrR family transcriptional regulator [Streptomyces clavuligerus]|uniref:TetR/AcrR family transcriptional regulator n=1 Tax=Streptomyces clavuligerus TaxID=1901 RepID=UPI00017FF695|nr:TetR family transcriptional regulator [Streptomyces clavuligerus]EDY49268.1 tetR-family transcriptional regulatory protein [Streptomyces clavuligerus]WDN56170.1 TetR/AcrR family transcriptional regulator [Streptomyces clavuligerus]